tara:strand:- start:6540 stop:7517 length:978 start_codon:yes stop_codon:yes gene_type:complete
MASTSSITYCTDRDLQDVFPGISGFDLKRRIYNWTGPATNVYTAFGTGLITVLFADGDNLGAENDPLGTAEGNWNYNEDDDEVTYYNSTASPNDMVMEAGDDWTTIKTRFRKQASRLLESRIDANLSREVSKDREGNYPDIIVRATALQTVILLITAHDPNNEVLESFKSEYNEILEGLNAGTIVLPSDRTSDSKNGVIRDVTVNASSTVRPVELKGQYIGAGYDLLKVKVYIAGAGAGTSGAIGTAKYSVWNKNSSGLKNNQVVENAIITGDYDVLSGGLYIRWSGVTDASVAYETDEYEIEVFSSSLGTSTPSGIKTVTMSRR